MSIQMEPTKHNWAQFCHEPPLSESEYRQWCSIATLIRENDAAFDFMVDATKPEWLAVKETEKSDGWTGLVEWSDANRRLQRAEIRTFERWKTK